MKYVRSRELVESVRRLFKLGALQGFVWNVSESG